MSHSSLPYFYLLAIASTCIVHVCPSYTGGASRPSDFDAAFEVALFSGLLFAAQSLNVCDSETVQGKY